MEGALHPTWLPTANWVAIGRQRAAPARGHALRPPMAPRDSALRAMRVVAVAATGRLSATVGRLVALQLRQRVLSVPRGFDLYQRVIGAPGAKRQFVDE